MKTQAGWISATALFLLVSLYSPIYPREQWLQHIPTVLGLIVLAVAASRKKWLSTCSMASVCLFIWLHILGARYIYTYVPYDQWTAEIFGRSLGDVLGWKRNHFDRLVHFFFGVLAYVPLKEIARRHFQLPRSVGGWVAAASVLSLSAVYEVFEWLLTLTVSAEQARLYNGQGRLLGRAKGYGTGHARRPMFHSRAVTLPVVVGAAFGSRHPIGGQFSKIVMKAMFFSCLCPGGEGYNGSDVDALTRRVGLMAAGPVPKLVRAPGRQRDSMRKEVIN